MSSHLQRYLKSPLIVTSGSGVVDTLTHISGFPRAHFQCNALQGIKHKFFLINTAICTPLEAGDALLCTSNPSGVYCCSSQHSFIHPSFHFTFHFLSPHSFPPLSFCFFHFFPCYYSLFIPLFLPFPLLFLPLLPLPSFCHSDIGYHSFMLSYLLSLFLFAFPTFHLSTQSAHLHSNHPAFFLSPISYLARDIPLCSYPPNTFPASILLA